MGAGTHVEFLSAATDRQSAPLGDRHQLITGPGMPFGVHRALTTFLTSSTFAGTPQSHPPTWEKP
jgi:hypothetical protein